MFQFIPDWLPTRSDQLQTRNDELRRIDEDYLPTMHKMVEHQNKADEALRKLQDTFSEDQLEMYLDSKYQAQQATFYSGLIRRYDERRREIPVERYEIENDVQIRQLYPLSLM